MSPSMVIVALMSQVELSKICKRVAELLQEIEAIAGVEELADLLEDAGGTLMTAMIAKAQQSKHLSVSEITLPYLQEAEIALKTAL